MRKIVNSNDYVKVHYFLENFDPQELAILATETNDQMLAGRIRRLLQVIQRPDQLAQADKRQQDLFQYLSFAQSATPVFTEITEWEEFPQEM